MNTAVMVVATAAMVAASAWDLAEMKRAERERRAEEGNDLVTVGSKVSGRVKIILTGTSVALFWYAYLVQGSDVFAPLGAFGLAALFVILALRTRRLRARHVP